MPIDRITSSQFATNIRNALLRRTRRYDTAYGPIPDVVISPVSSVLEDQNNNRLRRVSLLLSLQNPEEFEEDDLDQLVFNEGIIRPEGSQATTTLTFRRSTPFSVSESGQIPRGTPVATAVDEASGQPITFITTEARSKANALAVLDPDTNLTVYEVNVPAVALVTGSDARVGPGQVTRPLRPLAHYDSVTNKQATQGGLDRYSNEELIELYLLAIASRQLSVPESAEFHARQQIPAAEDIHEVFGTDPLLERAATDAGAVDAYVVGDELVSTTENIVFLGTGQKMIVGLPPVVSIDSVVRTVGGDVFAEGDDYEVALDTSGVSGSVRAKDGIRFISGAAPALTIGEFVTVTYTYNNLIRRLQNYNEDREVKSSGSDKLYRLSERVDIFLAANLTVYANFTVEDIQDAVETAITDYINALKGGDNVEASDLQQVVRRLSGVDNFVVTRLTRDPTGIEAADVVINGNEHARIDEANLIITPV